MTFMAAHGARLLDNDWPILPIFPGAKKPGRVSHGVWCDYPEWQKHCDRPTKPFEYAVWRTWEGCGVGIACGAVVAVDIDVTDPAVAVAVQDLAYKMLGPTPLLRIGNAPKRLLVYRATSPFSGKTKAPIQILARGQQFVAFAVHPDTGAPYAWPEESPLDVPLSDIPAVDEAAVDAFLEKAIALVPPEMRPRRLATIAAAGGGHGLAGTRAAVASAMAFLANPDLHYDEWVRIGMALKGALGDDGQDLWDAFSAQSSKNDPAVTDKAWSSFRPTTIGAGTIYGLAQAVGWTPPADVILDGEAAAAAAANPAAALIASLEAPSRVAAEGFTTAPASPAPRIRLRTVPQDLHTGLPGALGLLVDWIKSTAISPQPWLAVGAALPALGVLMARRYRTPTDLRSNLYTIGLADSGGGKDHARKKVQQLFLEAGLAPYLGGDRIASGSAIATAITKHPAALFQLDEFGKVLGGMVGKKSPGHRADILPLLTQLYTSADGVFMGTDYADTVQRPRQHVAQPCVCLHGTTAPMAFWEAVEGGLMADGSIARFLVFLTDDSYPEAREPVLRPPPEDLVAAVKRITQGAAGHTGGNLSAVMAADVSPVPYTVPLATGAAAMVRALKGDERAELRAAEGTANTSVLARRIEQTLKVALVRAVATNPDTPIMTEADVTWASKLVSYCIDTLILQADRWVSRNETEADVKRVARAIQDAGEGGIDRSRLMRAVQSIPTRRLNEILQALVEAERVAAESVATTGRPRTVYRWLR